MIFDVEPAQIEELDPLAFVELLRRLLYAEASTAGIDLRAVSVPLQITVADGGEDARIVWSGGQSKTNFLPSRFCVFQAKANDPGVAGWRKEVWSKTSARPQAKKKATKKKTKKRAARTLNEAVKVAISENGSYVGFTATALVGRKPDDRIEAIREGIRDCNADPDKLATIEIYDANIHKLGRPITPSGED